jgi:hypothetical protein
MKISYTLSWCADDGTAYRQTIRITEDENKRLFNGQFKQGANYGNAYTGGYIASKIYNIPKYKKDLKRIIPANTIVFVGDGVIPIYGGPAT